ncbi:hypothetical protein DAPPUDRAFT_229509 [Daphnia pulex]|uniref:Uncharacterized protein n=1 Tax=Daphnia pulex TaxID=6669 RepID=E9HQA7_DAPPU|nr:hypothetical protein DAPPUDRAFT_229509 [Daphnia pulex]|eukprot:EFX66089.1 hypothetical protein DAPPUDRAFT_229509 [Daphnia pulex]
MGQHIDIRRSITNYLSESKDSFRELHLNDTELADYSICENISTGGSVLSANFPGSEYREIRLAYNGFNHYYGVGDVIQSGQPTQIIRKPENLKIGSTDRLTTSIPGNQISDCEGYHF